VLLEVWMGATEADRLDGTGYPLEVVKGFVEQRQRTLDGLLGQGGLPQPGQSMDAIRRENVEVGLWLWPRFRWSMHRRPGGSTKQFTSPPACSCA